MDRAAEDDPPRRGPRRKPELVAHVPGDERDQLLQRVVLRADRRPLEGAVAEVGLQRLDEAALRLRGEIAFDRRRSGDRGRPRLEVEDGGKGLPPAAGRRKRDELRRSRFVDDGNRAVRGAEVDTHPRGCDHLGGSAHLAASFRRLVTLRIVAGMPRIRSSERARDLRLAERQAAQPVQLAFVDVEVVVRAAEGLHGTPRRSRRRIAQERDVEPVIGRRHHRGGKWLVGRGLLHLGGCPDERRDFVAERRAQVLFDLALERRSALARRVEEHVAARDERLDLRKAELLEQRAQAVHLDDPPADVDGAQKRDVSRHQTVLSVHGIRSVRL